MKKNAKSQSKNRNNITNKRNNNNVNNSSNKENNNNVGFVAEDHSFELDENNEHSFELRDCK